MKITIAFLLLFVLPTQNEVNGDQTWLADIKNRVDRIDKNASLKKRKSKSNWVSQSMVFEKYKKLTFETNNDQFVDYIYIVNYVSKEFVFCRKISLKAPYFRKGVRTEKDPLGEITNTESYFQSETYGIELKRTIDYFEKSNIDSLNLELKKLAFDTLIIGSEEYQSIKSGYIRLKKS